MRPIVLHSWDVRQCSVSDCLARSSLVKSPWRLFLLSGLSLFFLRSGDVSVCWIDYILLLLRFQCETGHSILFLLRNRSRRHILRFHNPRSRRVLGMSIAGFFLRRLVKWKFRPFRIWLIRFEYGFLFHIHTICPCLLVCLSRRIRYNSCYVY